MEHPVSSPVTRPLVLFVDDLPWTGGHVGESLRRMIGRRFSGTLRPVSLSAALEMVRTDHPDLIAIGYDHNLQATASLNLARALKADTVTCAVPILLLGSRHNPKLQQLMENDQAVAWMPMPPSDITALIDLLNRLAGVM